MTFSPHDIKKFEENLPLAGIHQYSRTLGKAEYELIAEDLIRHAQNTGTWVALTSETFRHHFENHFPSGYEVSQSYVDMMVRKGILVQTREGVMLSEKAIEAIVSVHPARPQANT